MKELAALGRGEEGSKQSPILREIDFLEKEISNLEAHVEALINRLAYAIRQETTTCKTDQEKAPEPIRCDFANILHKNACRLRNQCDRIQDIMSVLEL